MKGSEELDERPATGLHTCSVLCVDIGCLLGAEVGERSHSLLRNPVNKSKSQSEFSHQTGRA